ncbi:PREDICTED: zinc finger BED domain-containing protein RICESLEEPER 2-like isoform X2 [Nelumbo nucifera]|uniref:Zinc finger BED domain-containing protein RICESLEEPER 2-like isoform X2 n=1 Tax=Nelumbo nucifera TaxID=4432 RepID=A0A1U8A492_NELNU|nr:PREDICTED: zinc finger BED domain-containing protein RICESLEEPER 2-like isoform X2 [Nelumbo nucifera]
MSEPTSTSVAVVEANENTNIGDVSSSKIIHKRKRTSKVWEDFDLITKPSGVQEAICKHCRHAFVGGSASGTTHLKNHLPRCKSRRFKDPLQQLLAVTKTASEKCVLEPFKFDAQRSRLDLVRFIISYGCPFDVVENPFFGIFTTNLNPSFKIISRNTIRNDCLKLYKQEKEKLYKYLDTLSCRFSITIDMWTSTQRLSYCAVTVHYINNAWQLNHKIIAFTAMRSPYDGKTLCRVIMDVALDWNIDKKLFSITTDTISNNDVMVKELKKHLNDRSLLPLCGDLFHIHCSSHIFNFIVQDVLGEVSELLYKIRESVKYVKSSQLREQKFENAKNQVKIFPKKEMFIDTAYRWNSTYEMLDCALEMKEAFCRLKDIDHDYHIYPSEEEWKIGSIIRDCLKIFYNTTNKFSGRRYPTANIFFTNVCTINLKLQEWGRSGHPFLRSMAFKIKEKFDKYWEDNNLVLAIAIVLDPRFKMQIVEYYYNKIYGFEADKYISRVRTAIFDLYMEYGGELRDLLPSQSQASLAESGSSNLSLRFGFEVEASDNEELADFDKWCIDSGIASNIALTKSELDVYLEENLFPRSKDFDILGYWKLYHLKRPKLSAMARDILAIPATTIASEEAFNTSARAIHKYHTCLRPEVIEALMCGQSWLEPTIKTIDGEMEIHEEGGCYFDSVIQTN